MIHLPRRLEINSENKALLLTQKMGRHFSKVGATVILGPLTQKKSGGPGPPPPSDAYVPAAFISAIIINKIPRSNATALHIQSHISIRRRVHGRRVTSVGGHESFGFGILQIQRLISHQCSRGQRDKR